MNLKCVFILLILAITKVVLAQDPLYLFDLFDRQTVDQIYINLDQSAIILGTHSSQTTRHMYYHIDDMTRGMTSPSNVKIGTTSFDHTNIYAKDDQFYLTGSNIFECDIFFERPYLTIIDAEGEIIFSEEYHSDIIEELNEYRSPGYFFGFGSDHIILLSDHQFILMDYNGMPIGVAQNHTWEDVQNILWLADGFLIVRTSSHTFVDDQGVATGQESMIDFGEILDQDDLHVYSLIDNKITVFTKADLSIRSALDLPEGELIDINFSANGIALLIEDQDDRLAYHYDLDLNPLNDISIGNLGRWTVKKVAVSDQQIIGAGSAISSIYGPLIIDKLDSGIDFTRGSDVAIRDLSVDQVGRDSWTIEIEYSYILENLSMDTIYFARILSGLLSQYGCGEQKRLRNIIDSAQPLLPFEARPITSRDRYFSPDEPDNICLYVRSPNNFTDPDISNNSTCSLVNSTTNNQVKNNIDVYRIGKDKIEVNLNDFNSDKLIYISIYNTLGQLINQSPLLTTISNISAPDTGSSINLYQIASHKGKIKTGKIF